MEHWLEKVEPSVRLAGSACHAAGWIEPRRVIYEHELVLFEDGNFVVEFDDERIGCPSGSFIIVPPLRWHVTRMLSESGTRRWVHFSWSQRDFRASPIMTYSPGTPENGKAEKVPPWLPGIILHGLVEQPRQSAALHSRIVAHGEGGVRESLARRGSLLELLATLLAPAGEHDGARDDRALASRVRHALEEYALRRDSNASVKSALQELGASYEHAERQFRLAYGTAPVEFITSVRLEAAKALLASTDMPVAEIAAKVMLPHASYFARIFRRAYGTTPRTYRDRMKRG